MCFAPQRCAFFRQLNLKKWPEPLKFSLTLWLAHVLRATAACHSLTSELEKVVCVLYILTCKCASRHSTPLLPHLHLKNCSEPLSFFCFLTWKCALRHSGVPFFISLLSSYLCTRRFSEATFRTSGQPNHRKKRRDSRLSSHFPRLYLLSSDSSDSPRVLIFFLLTWLL